MHLFHIPQFPIQDRNVHTSVLNPGALWVMEQVQGGICEFGQFSLILDAITLMWRDCNVKQGMSVMADDYVSTYF